MAYDDLNRLTSKTLPGGEVVSFTYDAVGRYLTADDGDSTITRSYDPATYLLASEQTTVNGGPVRTVSYGYDASGRLSTVTYPSGRVVTHAYDGLGRLGSIASANGTDPATSDAFAYDARGRLASVTAGNGVVTGYAYNDRDLVAAVGHQTSGGADVLTLGYAYNGANNRTQRTETGQVAGPDEHYGYDPVDRLVRVDGNPTPVYETFGYDAAGNRTSDAQGTAYTYDLYMNRLLGMGGTTFAYDASGNLTSRADGGETVTYTWDALNQLTGVAYATAGDAVAYRYDALGRRIERAHTAPGQETTTDRWVYVDQNAVQMDRDGAVWQEYVHQGGLDNPLALVDHSGASVAAYYYHRDGLGSVRALTDVTQTVAQSYAYTSYGVTTMANPGGLDQPFQYTAREWDAPSGLYYYRARYYDPAAGRFLSHDPIRHYGGYNLYAYANANPVNAADPTGLCCGWDLYFAAYSQDEKEPNTLICVWLCLCTGENRVERLTSTVRPEGAKRVCRDSTEPDEGCEWWRAFFG